MENSIPKKIRDLIDLFDSKAIKTAASRVKNEAWDLSFEELEKKVRPTKIDWTIRRIIWDALVKAMHDGKKIKITSIHKGVCSYTHLYEGILANPYKLAWLLQPIRNFQEELEPLVGPTLNRLKEIIALPVQKENGAVDSKNAKLIFRAAEILLNNSLGNPSDPKYVPLSKRDRV